jgi:hypothetical protein
MAHGDAHLRAGFQRLQRASVTRGYRVSRLASGGGHGRKRTVTEKDARRELAVGFGNPFGESTTVRGPREGRVE